MDLNRIRSIGVVCALAAIAAASACLAALAAAAPVTPVKPAPGVPSHGRAWELTTSPEPTGSATFGWRNGASLTPDGNRVMYENSGLLPGFPYSQLFPRMVSTRGPDGWSAVQPLGPRDPSIRFSTPVALGPEGAELWTDEKKDQSYTLYRRDLDGHFENQVEDIEFLAASPDLQRVILSSSAHLLPADAGRTELGSIYELDGSTLRLLDVDAGGALISNCGTRFMLAAADASRAYFIADPNCEEGEYIYLAERGAGVREVAQTGGGLAAFGGALISTTTDGSSLLFKSVANLTAADENSRVDLYRYDAEEDRPVLISSGPGVPEIEVKRSPTLSYSQVGSGWSSPDGSRVYFYAAELIGPGETGETNIYLADAGGVHSLGPTATTTLIDVSADGRYAVLNSTEPLAPGDSDGLSDVYRYDATSGDFTRISQGPVGGNGALPAQVSVENLGTLPGPSLRVITADGSRIFFNTAERLVPEDTNGIGDVYEWAGGDVGLISSGVGKFPATFLTVTPDGVTALIKTAEVLLASDRDGDEYDYYAARIGGGFPEEPPAPDPCPCREAGPARKQLAGDAVSANRAGGRIVLPPIGAAQRRRFARSGWIELLAEAPSAGRLSAEARARIGRRVLTVATASVGVSEAGPVRLRMRLAKAARERLAVGKGLRVQLRVGLAGNPEAGSSMQLPLKGAR